MKRYFGIFTALVLALAGSTAGARGQAETAVSTDQGPVTLHVVHHASFVLDWNGKTIYVDPVGPAARYAGLDAPDVILITHAHPDHFSQQTLTAIDAARARVVMPQAVADKLDADIGDARSVMDNGETIETQGVRIRAVAMYNLPPSDDSYHPKGWGNGYVLTLAAKRIYISGDTEGIPEMRSLDNIDVAFVCMNLPYTMDVQHAADAVSAFKPAVVYPYHYRGQNTQAFKRRLNKSAPEVAVRLRDWYAAESSSKTN